jgi:hypothetical protein
MHTHVQRKMGAVSARCWAWRPNSRGPPSTDVVIRAWHACVCCPCVCVHVHQGRGLTVSRPPVSPESGFKHLVFDEEGIARSPNACIQPILPPSRLKPPTYPRRCMVHSHIQSRLISVRMADGWNTTGATIPPLTSRSCCSARVQGVVQTYGTHMTDHTHTHTHANKRTTPRVRRGFMLCVAWGGIL